MLAHMIKNILLSEAEARVLGALIEKEITTPEYYPMSLNALVNACNQKSNREPVMNLDDNGVLQALSRLDDDNLAGIANADSRVTKYEHRLQEVFNFHRNEIAVLCVLLLRGPQTLGELRTRTERMYKFEDLDGVQAALQKLMQREPALAKLLPRVPGTKEARYAHLLSGDVQVAEVGRPRVEAPSGGGGGDERVGRVEEDVAALRREVEDIKKQLLDFRKQFE
jgi:uncharacterized protein YceH (UPF0502 family)